MGRRRSSDDTEQSSAESTPTPRTASELELLRDILYGEQSRNDEKRISDLADRMEQQITDLKDKLRASQEEVSALRADHESRMRTLQSEALARHENLRQEFDHRMESLHQELTTLIASLDNRKTSRQDLAQMLLDMSQKLRTGDSLPPVPASRPPAANPEANAEESAKGKAD